MSGRSSVASEDESGGSEEVETLLAGRQRRINAANRYDREKLVAEVEDDEDEVTMLFKEEEGEGEDEDFAEDEEDEEDAALSSSDDDDQGPNVVGDDFEGEKELQKEAKAERAKKRKADLALTTAAGLRKRVRIDPRVPSRPSAKPPKKKERSYLINDYEVTRTSSRKQTLANTETIRAKLVEDEKVRLKHKARREKKERERELARSKEMTQAERLAEAEKIERRNAKSFNRWEAMEKKRAEEQAAKLAALKNRKLEGPVISVWSGVRKWIGPRVDPVLTVESIKEITEVKKRGRKPKAYHEQMAALQRLSQQQQQQQQQATPDSNNNATQENEITTPSLAGPESELPSADVPKEANNPVTFVLPQGPEDFLSGIHEYTTTTGAEIHALESQSQDEEKGLVPESQQEQVSSEGQNLNGTDEQPAIPEKPPTSPIIEYATENLVGLQKFDELSIKERNEYALFFHSRRSARPQKHLPEVCPITGFVARYRDRSTGIAYGNSFAYRKLQELKRHEHTWSSMLGCYVGRRGVVARGVPEGFLG